MAFFSLFWVAMVTLVNIGIIQFIQEKNHCHQFTMFDLTLSFPYDQAEIEEFGEDTMYGRSGPWY